MAMWHCDFGVFSKFRGELMGIAILGVCLLHGLHWAGMDGTLLAKLVGPFARIAFTEGFLFLSGFGLFYSFSRNGDKRVFYRKRLHRVLLPYMMMALPFFLYGLVRGDITWTEFILKESSMYFWLFGNDGMWYISVSVVLYAVFPFVYQFVFGVKEEHNVIMRAVALIALSVAACIALCLITPGYYKLVEIGISKTPMFVIGMLVAYLARSGKTMSLHHLLGGGYTAGHHVYAQTSLRPVHAML